MSELSVSDACTTDACTTDACTTDACMTEAATRKHTDTRVTWTSEAFESTPVLLRRARHDEPCGMFHVPIADVTVDGLDPLWREGIAQANDTYDAAELACGHVFNACALAIHFCTNDMRCPVCRRGPLEKAQISSFAPAMQLDLARTKLAIHARAADDNNEDFGVHLNLEALVRDIVFEVYMQWSPTNANAGANRRDSSTIITSPVRLDHDPLLLNTPAPVADKYATHHSFQRRFNINLKNMKPGENIMVLGLTHPLMPDAVRSRMFDKATLIAAANAGTRITLARNFGYVIPVNSDAGLILTLYLHTDYLAMACMQQMINLQQHSRS